MSMINFLMEDKVVIITGAGQGIGKAFALRFAEAGAKVSICDWNNESLEQVAEEIKKSGKSVLALKADVSQKNDIDNVVRKTSSEFGTIDILVNNAAFFQRCPFFDTDNSVWSKTIDVNLKGTYFFSQAVAKVMTQNKKAGCIINMASTLGIRGTVERSAYAISKAGVVQLTRVLARELGPYQIRVNAIAPHHVVTPMAATSHDIPGFLESIINNTPLGRLGELDDIVNTALFLASDAASFVTGQILVVDGGAIV